MIFSLELKALTRNMAHMRLFLFAIIGFFLHVQAATACPQNLYDAGNFAGAEELSEGLETTDGYALAAKSALVLARYYTAEEHRIPVVERAMAHAKKALELKPDNLEAHLHLAIAHGYRGRITRNPADARRSKNLIQAALEINPENPWALASFAGWHGEVSHRAGGFMGSLMFGASSKKSRQLFRDAIRYEPRNGAFRLGFAKMLLRTQKVKWRNTAETHLNACQDIEATTAFEAIVQHECKQLRAAITDKDVLKKLLDSKATPYPDLAALRWFAVK